MKTSATVDYEPIDLFEARKTWRAAKTRKWTIHPVAIFLAVLILGGVLLYEVFNA